jgi:nicotinate phosphoribosyltransferase
MAEAEFVQPIPKSVLDTDLYKVCSSSLYRKSHLTISIQLSMQQAVLQHFPNIQAVYRFTHRSKDVYFSQHCIERFKSCLPRMFVMVLACYDS